MNKKKFGEVASWGILLVVVAALAFVAYFGIWAITHIEPSEATLALAQSISKEPVEVIVIGPPCMCERTYHLRALDGKVIGTYRLPDGYPNPHWDKLMNLKEQYEAATAEKKRLLVKFHDEGKAIARMPNGAGNPLSILTVESVSTVP